MTAAASPRRSSAPASTRCRWAASGLLTMRERATAIGGTIRIDSSRGRGDVHRGRGAARRGAQAVSRPTGRAASRHGAGAHRGRPPGRARGAPHDPVRGARDDRDRGRGGRRARGGAPGRAAPARRGADGPAHARTRRRRGHRAASRGREVDRACSSSRPTPTTSGCATRSARAPPATCSRTCSAPSWFRRSMPPRSACRPSIRGRSSISCGRCRRRRRRHRSRDSRRASSTCCASWRAGMGNKQIAAALNLSVGTVKGYVSAILPKINAGDRTQAALFAVKHGLEGGA